MRIAQTHTAAAAYHVHRESGKSSAQRNEILGFIKERRGDWSIGELSHALGIDKSTVSARVNELLYETEELRVGHKRKDRRSGVTVRPVRLPELQFDMFSEVA